MLVHALAVVFVGVATAWNSRENGFVWDDRAAVLANTDVDTSASNWYQIFAHDFWGFPIDTKSSHKSYRPLTILTFRWDFFWHGYDAYAFHRTNVLVHALCALLVWQTARIVLYKINDGYIFKQDPMQTRQKHRYGALLAGLLFAVHPIHCDSIASIVGRADLLCVLFALSGFVSYSRVVQTQQVSWTKHFAAAIALGVCASLCKELGFTVFGIYVAYEIICACSVNDAPGLFSLSSPRCQRLACLCMGALCILVLRLWINGSHTTATFNILANSINLEPSRTVRMLSYAHVHAWYLWKLVWPSWFSYDYGFNSIPVIYSLSDPRNALTLVAYAAVSVGIIKGVRDIQCSPLLLCIAFGVVPFVPVSNVFFPVGTIVAERLLYFPSVGFCLIIGYAADQFSDVLDRLEVVHSVAATTVTSTPITVSASVEKVVVSNTRTLTVGLIGFIILTGFHKSTVRNSEWKSEEALFTAAVQVVPENVKALNNAAKILLNTDPVRSLQTSRTAVALLFRQVEGQSNLGLAYTFTPKTLLAIRHMLKAFAFSTNEFSGVGYTGTNLYHYWLRQHEEHGRSPTTDELVTSPTITLAAAFLDEAIRRGSTYPSHFFIRGLIAERLKDYRSALRYMELAQQANERVARLSMDSELLLSRGSILNMVAVLRRQLGDEDRALSELLTGIDLYPAESSLYFNVAAIYLNRGMHDWAAKYLDRCVKVCTQIDSLVGGARMLERLGQQEAAAIFHRKAAELQGMSSPPNEY